ncbi:DUF6907 domain-containing protein [Actinomyces capricornis]|uniref:DUF6907 domain-containing protein n=1 Tax=Actinomyces capricornis TaxID=2755559 RepID=UPI0035713A50
MSERYTPEGAGACPAWCVLPHDNTDYPADAVHEAAPCLIPGVVLERHGDGTGRPIRQAVAAELSVVRYRYETDSEEWVYVGDGCSGLDLSPETARRLAHAITALLDSTTSFRPTGPRLADLQTYE